MRAYVPLRIEQLLACRRLEDFAPRLAAARDGLRRARRHRSYLREMVLKRERLVAHRDLQLVRAYATRSRRYIGLRERKLEAARRELAYFQQTLDAAEREAA